MPTPILAIMGQSNAAGRGSVEFITDYQARGYDQPYGAVMLMDKVAGQPVGTDPITWAERGPITLRPLPGGNAGICGIELSLGRALTELGLTHAIAKVAIGSTSLAMHWNPSGSYPSTGPILFDQAMTFLRAAEVALGGYIALVIWIQGETDSTNLGQANAYGTHLAALVHETRLALGSPSLPFLYNRLHTAAGGAFTSTVRGHQDDVSEVASRARVLDIGEDLALNGVHFQANSYVTLGQRFAPHVMKWLGLTSRSVSVGVGISL